MSLIGAEIPPAIDDAAASAILKRAIERYVAARHGRVEAFVDANYGLLGALRLHRRALGLDLLRAPANVAMLLPYAAMQLGAAGLGGLGARRAGRWLRARKPFFETDVARELTFRLHRDLLELPYDDSRNRTGRDALALSILEEQPLADLLDRLRAETDRPGARARVRTMLETYAGARHAAADLFNNALLAGTGAALFQSVTPGTFSLAPVLATALAHQAAVASFPLGAGLGGLWYAWFPAQPSIGLLLGTTGGLILLTAVGLHGRRLHRLIDVLGRELCGESAVAFEVRDHYLARIFDLVDLGRAAARTLAG
jgi:hypothetical protein